MSGSSSVRIDLQSFDRSTAYDNARIHNGNIYGAVTNNIYNNTGKGDPKTQLLSTVCPDHQHEEHIDLQKRLTDERLAGTCKWLLEDRHYVSWRDGQMDTLWCSGLAGCGKTFMCSMIVDDLKTQNPKHKVAFLYFQRGQAADQTEEAALRALTRQLLEQHQDVPNDLHMRLMTRSPSKAQRLSALKSLISLSEKVSFVIDAIDEFSTSTSARVQLLKTLSALYKDEHSPGPHPQLRICLTGRDSETVNIRSTLRQFVQLEVQASPDDLSILITDRLEASDDVQWLCQSFVGDMRSLIVDRIIEKSHRIFRLASLQLEAVINAAIGTEQVLACLATLHESMEAYYEDTWRCIQAIPEPRRSATINLLQWLTFAMRRPNPEVLSAGLGLYGRTGAISPTIPMVNVAACIALTRGFATVRHKHLKVYGSGKRHMFSFTDDSSSSNTSDDATGQDPILYKLDYVLLTHETVAAFLESKFIADGHDCRCQILTACLRYFDLCRPMRDPLFYALFRDTETTMMPGKTDFENTIELGQSFHEWALRAWGLYVPERVTDDDPSMSAAIKHMRSIILQKELHPLHYCALRGWLNAARWILQEGANPNHEIRANYELGGTLAYTPCHVALCFDRKQLFELFVQSEKFSSRSGSPYEMLECGHDKETFEMLLDRQLINPNWRANDGMPYICCLLSRSRDEPSTADIESLLGRPDLDVNARGASGETAVHIAALSTAGRHRSTIEKLLGRKELDVNARTDHGDTAFDFALMCVNAEFLEQLLMLDRFRVPKPCVSLHNITTNLMQSCNSAPSQRDFSRLLKLVRARRLFNCNEKDVTGNTVLSDICSAISGLDKTFPALIVRDVAHGMIRLARSLLCLPGIDFSKTSTLVTHGTNKNLLWRMTACILALHVCAEMHRLSDTTEKRIIRALLYDPLTKRWIVKSPFRAQVKLDLIHLRHRYGIEGSKDARQISILMQKALLRITDMLIAKGATSNVHFVVNDIKRALKEAGLDHKALDVEMDEHMRNYYWHTDALQSLFESTGVDEAQG